MVGLAIYMYVCMYVTIITYNTSCYDSSSSHTASIFNLTDHNNGLYILFTNVPNTAATIISTACVCVY